jgi:protein-disulfide isomerase
MKFVLFLTCLLMASTLFGQKPLVEGDPSSPVRVVIYEDLQCPDCANFRKMLDAELLPRFKGTVAFEHHDFPLAKHVWARPAAIAARYFEGISPVLAVEFRQTTMASQEKITPETFDAYLTSFATAHKVESAKVIAALTDPALTARVESEFQEGVSRGVAHTPTVLVNGEPFVESFPSADIIKSIERELAAYKK